MSRDTNPANPTNPAKQAKPLSRRQPFPLEKSNPAQAGLRASAAPRPSSRPARARRRRCTPRPPTGPPARSTAASTTTPMDPACTSPSARTIGRARRTTGCPSRPCSPHRGRAQPRYAHEEQGAAARPEYSGHDEAAALVWAVLRPGSSGEVVARQGAGSEPQVARGCLVFVRVA